MTTQVAQRQDIYSRITDKVIAGLQDKGLKWFKPWTDGSGSINPINHVSGKPYRGINIMLLSAAMHDGEYTYNEWCTYKQAAAKGGQVRKGEKSTQIIFWVVSFYHRDTQKWYSEAQLKKAKIKRSECDERWTIRGYNVFNIAQCDGLTPRTTAPVEAPKGKIEQPRLTYEGMPEVKWGGNHACYRPSRDIIEMPNCDQFKSNEACAMTLYHEMIHSTGAEHRLNRKAVTDFDGFGSDRYAQEELVAEIGAQFLMALTSAEAPEQSQAYINGWVKQLTDHPKMVVFAAQQATQATEYIIK